MFSKDQLLKITHSLAVLKTIERKYINEGEVPDEWRIAISTLLNDPLCRFVFHHVPRSQRKYLIEQYAKEKPEKPRSAYLREEALKWMVRQRCCPQGWSHECRELSTLQTAQMQKMVESLQKRLEKADDKVKVYRVKAGVVASEDEEEEESSTDEEEEEEEQQEEEKELLNPFLKPLEGYHAYVREAKLVNPDEHWARVQQLAVQYKSARNDQAKEDVLTKWRKYQHSSWSVHKRKTGIDTWSKGQEEVRKCLLS